MTGFWDHGRGLLSPPDDPGLVPGTYWLNVHWKGRDEDGEFEESEIWYVHLETPEDSKETDSAIRESVLDEDWSQVCDDTEQAIKTGVIWWDAAEIELDEADEIDPADYWTEED